jgi:hypothetical protein
MIVFSTFPSHKSLPSTPNSLQNSQFETKLVKVVKYSAFVVKLARLIRVSLYPLLLIPFSFKYKNMMEKLDETVQFDKMNTVQEISLPMEITTIMKTSTDRSVLMRTVN